MCRGWSGESEVGIRKACGESWVSKVWEGWIGQRLSSKPQSRIPNPGLPGGPSARSVEIPVDPGVVEVLDFGQRAARPHLPVREYRHAVADRVQGVDVVGDEAHVQAQRRLDRKSGESGTSETGSVA